MQADKLSKTLYKLNLVAKKVHNF